MHLFFVDDFARQTFARNKKETLQLDLITQFTKDIDMKFGPDKCAYTSYKVFRNPKAQNFLLMVQI